jgi:hypothetical protein
MSYTILQCPTLSCNVLYCPAMSSLSCNVPQCPAMSYMSFNVLLCPSVLLHCNILHFPAMSYTAQPCCSCSVLHILLCCPAVYMIPSHSGFFRQSYQQRFSTNALLHNEKGITLRKREGSSTKSKPNSIHYYVVKNDSGGVFRLLAKGSVT